MTNQTTTSGEPIATCMYCRATAGNHVVNCPCRDDILVGTNSLLYDEILLKNAKIMKTIKLNKADKQEVQLLFDEIHGIKKLLSDLAKRRGEIDGRMKEIILVPFKVTFDKYDKIDKIEEYKQ